MAGAPNVAETAPARGGGLLVQTTRALGPELGWLTLAGLAALWLPDLFRLDVPWPTAVTVFADLMRWLAGSVWIGLICVRLRGRLSRAVQPRSADLRRAAARLPEVAPVVLVLGLGLVLAPHLWRLVAFGLAARLWTSIPIAAEGRGMGLAFREAWRLSSRQTGAWTLRLAVVVAPFVGAWFGAAWLAERGLLPPWAHLVVARGVLVLGSLVVVAIATVVIDTMQRLAAQVVLES